MSNGAFNCLQTEILAEESFIRALSFERRRAERSTRHSVLMLLHFAETLDSDQRCDVLQKVVRALSGAMRETDLTGWYERSSKIGVILTEIDPANMNAAFNAVEKRVRVAMRTEVNVRVLNEIQFSFQPFPDGVEPSKAALERSSGRFSCSICQPA